MADFQLLPMDVAKHQAKLQGRREKFDCERFLASNNIEGLKTFKPETSVGKKAKRELLTFYNSQKD